MGTEINNEALAAICAELLWTLMSRTGYVDARMGLANAMGYVSIFLSIIFTIYFFRKLSASRAQLGMAGN